MTVLTWSFFVATMVDRCFRLLDASMTKFSMTFVELFQETFNCGRDPGWLDFEVHGMVNQM